MLILNGLFIAPGNTGLWMMIPSMTADIVDEDELQTSERREGSYAAVFAWVFKMSTAVAFGLAGPILELTGFKAEMGVNQSEGVLTTMRLLMVAVPVLALVAAMALAKRYTLDANRMHAIRAELEARRGMV
jgi:GPH family glycoside/pentoside/hexuronide:cation symporter